ncbi:ester cyclase [Streptomyces sp. MAR4 CNY-716]
MSTPEEARNKAEHARLIDALNARDPERMSEVIGEVFKPDVRLGTPLPVRATGAQAVTEVFATLHRAFPDLHIAVDDLIAEDDKLVARQTVTGTHEGEYMGHAPTGRSVTYREIFVMRFEDGRVAETWGVVDVLAQLRQLGLLPS